MSRVRSKGSDLCDEEVMIRLPGCEFGLSGALCASFNISMCTLVSNTTHTSRRVSNNTSSGSAHQCRVNYKQTRDTLRHWFIGACIRDGDDDDNNDDSTQIPLVQQLTN